MKASEIIRLRSSGPVRAGSRTLRIVIELGSVLVLLAFLVQEIGLHAQGSAMTGPSDSCTAPVARMSVSVPADCADAKDLVHPANFTLRAKAPDPPVAHRPQARRPVAGSALHGAIVPLQ